MERFGATKKWQKNIIKRSKISKSNKMLMKIEATQKFELLMLL